MADSPHDEDERAGGYPGERTPDRGSEPGEIGTERTITEIEREARKRKFHRAGNGDEERSTPVDQPIWYEDSQT